MISVKFTHNISGFSPVGILTKLGVTPISHPMHYPILVGQAFSIIEFQVMITANALNKILKEAYRRDMSLIYEYINFPRYMDTVDIALSRPGHVDVVWEKGNIQAKFVDTTLLGDLDDLKRIQRVIWPSPGTLEGWIGLYMAWRNRGDKKYIETINGRLDIMESQKIAPFLELIEYGNQGMGAWPENGPYNTLSVHFKAVYKKEMKRAFNKCLSLISLMIKNKTYAPLTTTATAVSVEGETYLGYKWVSPRGNIVFVKQGTAKMIGKRLSGEGFLFSKFGKYIKKFKGFIK